MRSRREVKGKKEESSITNIDASLERLKKVRALHCEPDYIGIDTLVLKMLPFSRPNSLY
jgi:hypothetical protein